jgi:methylmalonyl-CoA/ethylmalonyl-CoA epimerase
MAVQSLHHVGIAVRSIEAQRAYYEDVLGAKFEAMELVPDQQVRVAFFRLHDVRLELLEPTESSSPVQSFLDKRGEGLHHVAFAVEDIQSRIAEFKAAGCRLIDEVPRPGAHQMQIAFIHPKSTFGVLTELCEPTQRD